MLVNENSYVSSSRYAHRHIIEIDYLRCFAIFAVIYIHTASATMRVEETANLIPVIYLNSLAQFAVPLFICISGFVLYLSYKPSEGVISFYKKRYLRIIPPYLIFSTIYLIANIFKAKISEGMWDIPTTLDIIYAYVFAESNPHMWFFLIIIELYLLYPVLERIYRAILKMNMEWLFLLATLLLQVLWNIFSVDLVIVLDGVAHPLTNKIFLCTIFYFVLGICLSNHYNGVRHFLKSAWIYLLSLLTGLLCIFIPLMFSIMNVGDGIVGEVGFCTLAILVLFSIGIYLTDNSKFDQLVVIGAYSFGIYLIHPLIQGLFGYIIYPMIGIDPSMLIYYILVFITTSLISILGVYIIQKLPFHRYIIG